MSRLLFSFLALVLCLSLVQAEPAPIPPMPGRSGAPGPNDVSAQQVEAYARRLVGEGGSSIKTISARSIYILSCVGVNGRYEVRELASAPLDQQGKFAIKKKGNDFEINSDGAVSLDGKAWLFEGSSEVKMTIPPDKAPPAGQKPTIKMGMIRTYFSIGKPKYFAGSQAAEVVNAAGVASPAGVSVDLFFVVF